MKSIEIDARFVRAAQAAQAHNDVRYYLNGFCFLPDGRIAATNGHVLYVATYADDKADRVEHPIIVNVLGKVPTSAKLCTFIFQDDQSGFCKTDNARAYCFEVIDGKFPDIDRVLSPLKRLGEPKALSDGWSANANYLALLPKIFGAGSLVTCCHGTEHEPVVLQGSPYLRKGDPGDLFFSTSMVVLMPVRVGREFYRAGEEAA
ncbi:MAG: hypothetical protein AAGI11_15030 [Pseudomonadota bacterium]